MELPWSTIDMDFMNLNQAAHGDREFGYIQSRLGVPARPSPATSTIAVVAAAHRRWARAALGRARAAPAAAGPLRRQHARRRGHRGRQGRGPAALRRLGQHLRRQRPRRGRRRQSPTTTSTSWSPSTPTPTASRPSCCPAASGTSRCATAPGSSWACGRSSTDGGFGAFTTNFEDLGGLRQLPGPRRAAADGRRLRLRRRGRLEDVGAAARRPRRWPPACRAARRSWRTTPTTWSRARRRSSAPTCSRSARRSPRSRPSLEIHPLAIGGREDPVRLRFTADPGPGVVVGLSDLGDRFRLTVNEIDVVEPDEALPQLPVACAVWEPRPVAVDLGRGLADGRRPAPHGALDGGRRRGARTTSPR